MKKLVLIATAIGMAVLATSCCNKNGECKCPCCQQCEQKCEMGEPEGCPQKHHPCPKGMNEEEMKARHEKFCEMEAKWAKFDSLSADEQKALIAEKKAKIDERDSMIKAAREEFEAKWANFDNLTVEEQKMLLDAKMSFQHNGRFHKGHREMGPQCPKDGKGCPMKKGDCPKGAKPDCDKKCPKK